MLLLVLSACLTVDQPFAEEADSAALDSSTGAPPADSAAPGTALRESIAGPALGDLPALPVDCGPYAVQAGSPSRATYDLHDPQLGDGRLVVETLAADADGARRTREHGVTTDAAGAVHTWDRVATHRCNADGLRLVSVRSTTHTPSPEGERVDHAERTFSPPILVYPRDLQAGSGWTFASTVTETHEGGQTRTWTIDAERSAETLPDSEAGALRITEERADGTTDTLDVAPGRGVIRGGDREMVGFSAITAG